MCISLEQYDENRVGYSSLPSRTKETQVKTICVHNSAPVVRSCFVYSEFVENIWVSSYCPVYLGTIRNASNLIPI